MYVHLLVFSEDDVCETMYGAAFTNRPVTSLDDGAATSCSKVDVVCDAVKSALYSLDKDK